MLKHLAQSAVAPVDTIGNIPAVNLGPNDVYKILVKFASWMFAVFILAFILFTLFAAFKFLTAAGNESKIKEAYNAFGYALVALIAALLAGGVVALVNQLMGY